MVISGASNTVILNGKANFLNSALNVGLPCFSFAFFSIILKYLHRFLSL